MDWSDELKVNERKLLRQSKTLCSNRRNLFLESEDYTSYMEKSLAREMCIKFKSEEIRQREKIVAGVIRKRKRCGRLRCV